MYLQKLAFLLGWFGGPGVIIDEKMLLNVEDI